MRAPLGAVKAIALLTPSLLASACNDSLRLPTESTPSRRTSLELRTITPSPATVLTADTGVGFSATLRYDLGSASGGRVGVLIIGLANGALHDLEVGTLTTLPSTEGDVVLAFSHHIPAAMAGGALTVQFGLALDGHDTQSEEVRVEYRVEPAS